MRSPRHPATGAVRVALAAAVTVAAASGCTGPAGTGGGYVGGDGTLTRVAPAQRPPAPRLTGTTLEGRPFDSADLAGRVVVYNVWGSWCAPCRKEAPALAAAARATADKATFVGINTRDSGVAQAQALVREAGVGYESLYDPDGRLLLLFPALPPSAIPTTIVVDADGRIAARILGETTEATLVGLVDDVAAGR
nr:TlpA family protein disulfide reductase [Propionibacterium sp.]